MAAANSLSSSQSDQLTAPPGWTKKLSCAPSLLGFYSFIFKEDAHRSSLATVKDSSAYASSLFPIKITILREVPSQWHLRRYLKAHPGGPGFSDFDWSSGEESVRRSGRASTKEISYSEKITKGKRNASEMDAGGSEEGKIKTPVRKQAKNAVESDEKKFLPSKEEEMNNVLEGKAAGDSVVGQDAAEPATVVHIDEINASTGKVAESVTEIQVALADNATNVTDASIHEKPNREDVTREEAMLSHVATLDKPIVKVAMEQVVIVTNGLTYENPSIVNEVIEQVVNSTNVEVHEKPNVQEVTEKAANLMDLSKLENPNLEEVLEQVVESEGLILEVDDQANKGNALPVELPEGKTELKKDIREIGCFGSIKGLNGEIPVVDSGELQEAFDTGLAESKKLLDQNLEVTNVVIVQQQQPVDHNIEVSGAVVVESENMDDQDVTDADMVSKKTFEQNPGLTDAFVVESKKLPDENLGIPDSSIAESHKLFDEICEVMEDVENVTLEAQEHQGDVKSSLEPFMQREEQERLYSANNPPLQAEHVKEKSPSEIRSSSVSMFNQ